MFAHNLTLISFIWSFVYLFEKKNQKKEAKKRSSGKEKAPEPWNKKTKKEI